MILPSFGPQIAVATKGDEMDVDGDEVEMHIKANNRTAFRFNQRTRIGIDTNVNIDLKINCESKKIGEKDFEIEINGDKDLKMNMTCTEEESECGLEKGNTVRTRNRYRYRYQEGFCIAIECNGSCRAKLRIEATDENKGGTWAYYDEENSEWIPVETNENDGYLEAETDHFSIWTVIIPEPDYTTILIISIGIGIGVLIAVISLITIKKKREK
ncbi:MAG: hypothetical protein ACTSQJ_08875 [Promethearchaeota archaeon]